MAELTIVDWEQDEVVATVRDDGSYAAETPIAEHVLDRLVGDDGAVPWRYAGTGPNGETVEALREIRPGEVGYLYAVADALPAPLEPREWRGLDEPPVFEVDPSDDGRPPTDHDDTPDEDP